MRFLEVLKPLSASFFLLFSFSIVNSFSFINFMFFFSRISLKFYFKLLFFSFLSVLHSIWFCSILFCSSFCSVSFLEEILIIERKPPFLSLETRLTPLICYDILCLAVSSTLLYSVMRGAVFFLCFIRRWP